MLPTDTGSVILIRLGAQLCNILDVHVKIYSDLKYK